MTRRRCTHRRSNTGVNTLTDDETDKTKKNDGTNKKHKNIEKKNDSKPDADNNKIAKHPD